MFFFKRFLIKGCVQYAWPEKTIGNTKRAIYPTPINTAELTISHQGLVWIGIPNAASMTWWARADVFILFYWYFGQESMPNTSSEVSDLDLTVLGCRRRSACWLIVLNQGTARRSLRRNFYVLQGPFVRASGILLLFLLLLFSSTFFCTLRLFLSPCWKTSPTAVQEKKRSFRCSYPGSGTTILLTTASRTGPAYLQQQYLSVTYQQQQIRLGQRRAEKFKSAGTCGIRQRCSEN